LIVTDNVSEGDIGMFRRKNEAVQAPRDTELDMEWFTRWADDIRARKGKAELRAPLGVDSDVEVLKELWGKASAVIDHDCHDYVQRYLDRDALRRYSSYYASDEETPWGLVSLVTSLNTRDAKGWETFIVDDMRAKLARFADVLVDPSIVGT
jgi:hypothetical protein